MSTPHEQKLNTILDQLKAYHGTQPIGLSKNSVPHLVPNPKDARFKRPKINMRSLNNVIEINPQTRTCTAESGVAFVDLVRETLKYNLVPMTVPELKTITIGGAVSGCSMDYVRFSHFDTYWTFLKDRCALAEDDFIDGIIHGPDHFVACLGNFVDEAPRLSRYDREKIFYKSTAHLTEDYFTTSDYFFRYDTECHWLTSQIPLFENKIFRWLFGKYFLGSTNLITWSRRLRHIYGLKKRQDIVVDVFIPATRMTEFYTWYQKAFDFYPLWLVPYRMEKIYPLVSDGLQQILQGEHLFIDCAIYGKKNDDLTRDLSKELEDQVFNLNGVKTLIGKNHYSKEKFWKIYNKPLYEKVKKEMDPRGMFGEVFSKMCG